MAIEANILTVMCPTCKQENLIKYNVSVPLKFQCQFCDKVINIYQSKDGIDQTRISVGNIEKEDR
jgi:transposase-like protein